MHLMSICVADLLAKLKIRLTWYGRAFTLLTALTDALFARAILHPSRALVSQQAASNCCAGPMGATRGSADII